jgi:hypothetical protein
MDSVAEKMPGLGGVIFAFDIVALGCLEGRSFRPETTFFKLADTKGLFWPVDIEVGLETIGGAVFAKESEPVSFI